MLNLYRLRKKRGLTQQNVADYLGVTSVAYGYYETGKRQMSPEILSKLSDFFGVSTDVLLNREDIPDTQWQKVTFEEQVDFEDEVDLPVVASLQCGYGKCGDPFTIIRKHPVPKSYIKKYGDGIVLMYASGMSMLPTIRPGDLLVCYPGDIWVDGTIVIINVNDSDTVKRIYHATDGGIDLVPDNNSFKSVHYTPSDIQEYQIHVLGHVLTTIPPEITPIPRRREPGEE